MLIINCPQQEDREGKHCATSTQRVKEKSPVWILGYGETFIFTTGFLSKFTRVLLVIYMNLGNILSTELAHSNSDMPGYPVLFLVLKYRIWQRLIKCMYTDYPSETKTALCVAELTFNTERLDFVWYYSLQNFNSINQKWLPFYILQLIKY